MATSQFTVADAIARVDQLVRSHAASISRRDKIEAIDAANQQLWRLMALGYEGWFVTNTDLSLTDSDDDYDLPSNYHHAYFLEVTTSGKKDFRFKPAQMTSKEFRDKRRNLNTADSDARDFYFDIIGEDPAVFKLAQNIPAGETLNLRVWYVKRLDKLTATTDTLDPAIIPFFGPLCVCAAASLVAPRNLDLAAVLKADWAAQFSELMALVNRTASEPESTKVFTPGTTQPAPPGREGAL